MMTESPNPFPTDGLRKLSEAETQRRMVAMSCALPKNTRPSCSGQVFVGMFFDGTGNNMVNDYNTPPPEKRKHSNIVKLYLTHRDEPQSGYLSYYIPGVGTPFFKVGDSGKGAEATAGSAAAAKGEHRILWAFTRLLNAPHQFVFGPQMISDQEAKGIVDSLTGYEALLLNQVRKMSLPTQAAIGSLEAKRRAKLNALQERLKAELAKKPNFKVEQINLSVFGFSRGAAQARAFVNWLYEVCKRDGDRWTFAGITIRINFLGLLDTVASVGLTDLFDNGLLIGHQSWADDNLEIHPAVEQCVHYVAGHEVRACFPLDSVRVKSHYPDNAKEVMYPGAHSDVGGGYAPSALGISPTQDSYMSIIPGAQMYEEARKAGVPLQPLNMLDSVDPNIRLGLTPTDTVKRAFNAYLAAARVGSGQVEDMHRRHMALYHSYRFKHRASFLQRRPYNVAPTAVPDANDPSKIHNHQEYLDTTQDSLITQLGWLGGNPMDANFDPAKAARIGIDGILQNMLNAKNAAPLKKDTSKVSPKDVAKAAAAGAVALTQLGGPAVLFMASRDSVRARRLFEVAQHIDVKKVAPAIDHFFDNYIHDSMAGFIGMGVDEFRLNGSGIVKFRSVFKGNDFSLQRAAEEKARAAADYTVKTAKDAATYAQKKAQEAADFAARKTQEAADYTARKAQEAKAAAIKTYDAVAKKLEEEAIAAQKKAQDAAAFAQQKTREAAELAKQAAAEAQQAAEDGWKLFWNGHVWVAKRLLSAVSQ